MTEIEWARLKAHELRDLAARDAIVVIPIGATEQHGPHLPVMVDHRLVHEVATRAARLVADREPIVVTPVIPFGMSEHHVSLGGTLTLDFATMQAVLRCICESAIRQGFKRLFILNGHGGNIAALETIVTELTIKHRVPIGCAAYWQLASREIAALLERQTGVLHACEAETSMMMAAEPASVDTEVLPQCHGELIPGASTIAGVNEGAYRWRQLGTRSLNGVIGDAGAATADKGEALLAASAAALAATLLETRLWTAPI
jgi:creatinine amidohydrolase